MKSAAITYDAIVIGSGITGGWAAKELTERGLKTLVLERGRHVEHGKDYVTEHLPPYDFKYRLMGDRKLYERDYAVQSQSMFFGEGTQHFFVNDRLNPYSHDTDKPFTWIRGHQLGGRSLLWGRQSYRMSPRNFEENALDGHGVDWPIRYSDLAPWYSHVEKFIGVSGESIGHPMAPDGEFQKPYGMNCIESQFKARMAKSFPDRPVTMARMANLTEALGSRSPCHYCGICERGCSPGSYFSTLSSTLPAALATGRLTVKTDSIVQSLVYDARRNRIAGVRVLDSRSKALHEYRARIVFLCASTFESVRLLLNSANPHFAHGLANSSGTLGKYVMDHFPSEIAVGEIDGPAVPHFTGARPGPLFIPRFRNVAEQRKDYVRGYQMNAGAWPMDWRRGTVAKGVGADFKHSLRKTGQWQMILIAQGECLPRADNSVRLDPTLKDAWGIPSVRIDVTYGANEAAMRKDASAECLSMLQAAGLQNARLIPIPAIPGGAIHEMGGARMGRDRETSVLNGFNQSHDIPNLFVTDGAAMTSSSSANPSLTYMALTARAPARTQSRNSSGTTFELTGCVKTSGKCRLH